MGVSKVQIKVKDFDSGIFHALDSNFRAEQRNH